MPILPDYNALFIHIPKNAGRSIETALLPRGVASCSGRRSRLNRAAHLLQNLSASRTAARFLVGTRDVALCAQHLETPLDDLCSRLRGRTLTEARELIVSLGLQRWRQRGSCLASVLGLHPESVSRLSSRGRLKAAEVPDFARRLEDLDRAVAEMANDDVAP